MGCEACGVKFSLFKRKKQCTDCLRYFCSDCLIKRPQKIFNCDSCSVLSRRPLMRIQVSQMRPRDLRQYLVAKRVSVKGCVEKEDLVNLLMTFANGASSYPTTERSPRTRSESTSQESTPAAHSSHSENPPRSPVSDTTEEESVEPAVEVTERSDWTEWETGQSSETSSNVKISEPPESETSESTDTRTDNSEGNKIEIEEISGSYDSPTRDSEPEPMITEQDESSESSDVQQPCNDDLFTEIPVWPALVQLSDITKLSELEYLSVKQLKYLLSTNRVDYKDCIERSDLLDRVSSLWEHYKQSRTDIDKLDREDLCKICWDAPIECIILECGHMACCINCGKQMSECPICKRYVVRVVRFFKA